MRTVPFKSVLWGVARRMGLRPSENFSEEAAATLTDYVNAELVTAWQEFPWPELVTVEQRWFRPVWEVAAYEEGDEVYHADSEAHYVALADVLGTDVPGVSASWEAITALDRYVAYEQEGETALGEILGAWDGNPRASESARAVGYWLSDAGVQFSAEAASATVWLEFRLRVPEFTSEVYDEAAQYGIGERVYYPDTGECYVTVEESEDEEPAYSENWTRVQMPALLAPYVTQASYARALEEDGQTTKARSARMDAELLLTRAMQQFSTQGQMARFRVS